MPNSRPPPQAHTPADDITGSILTQKSINMQKQVSSNPNPLLESIRLISQSGNYKLEAERQGGARIPDSDFLGQLLPRVQKTPDAARTKAERTLSSEYRFFFLLEILTLVLVLLLLLFCDVAQASLKLRSSCLNLAGERHATAG